MKRILGRLFFATLLGTSGWGQTNLIQNGSFESGMSNWNYSSKFDYFSSSPCEGTFYALTADASGLAWASLTNEYVSQTVTIPSGAVSATLSFCYRLNTNSANSGVKLEAWFGSSLLDAYFYTDFNNGWQSASLDISNISSYSGQNVAVRFTANESASNSYWGKVYIDNVSLMVTSTPCTGVSVAAQPQNQTATEGGTATFSVSVNGDAPFQYFWYKNGQQIPGASNSSYTTPILSLSDNGNTYYWK